MRGLGLRLISPMVAVVLIGLAAIDVVFVFWSQRQLTELRGAELTSAALATSLALADGDLARAELEALAAEHDVDLTLLYEGGRMVTTLEPPIPIPEITGRMRVIADGYEHVLVRATHASALVVASRPLRSTVDEVLSGQRSALAFLLLVAASMVLLGMFFMRRAVLAPVARITGLVGRADRDGLSRFGLEAKDDFARLSQAIVTMTRRIDEDRQRIAAQLDDLRAAHERLRETQGQLVSAERLAVVGQLAAGLAHEIGNPLAVLTGYVEVLEDDELGAQERARAIAHMTRELDRIHVIMRDLLDFSRMPSSASGEGDVREAMTHVQKLLHPQERLREVDIEVELPQARVAVAMQTDALTQILLNLLLNAADAMAGCGRIRVVVTPGDGVVVITVDDAGPGVASDAADRVFEPFFTTKPAGAGTGLGLAVCHHMVTSVGGQISVAQSELGGARFTVTLPA